MNKKSLRMELLATTMVAGSMLVIAPAFAQTVPGQDATPAAPVVGGSSTAANPSDAQGTDASGKTAPAGEIVVTGSRIASPNLTSASPLTVVSAQEIKLEGATRVEDLLNSLPQAFADQSSGVSNGSSGLATVNLRDLGASRTLVLINGRRLNPADPRSPVADINFIPAALVQRVEVLTGGASSVYGSDAIGGVVNFVMNKDFSGFRADATYSLYQHDNANDFIDNNIAGTAAGRGFPFASGNTVVGTQRDVNITMGVGTDDGRGHITAYAGYRKINAVTQAEYDYSSCNLAESGSGFACGGSGTTSPARFITNGGAGSQLTLDPTTGNTFRPYVSSRDAYNFAPVNYYQRPDTRYTAGTFAHYDVSDHFKPYLEAMFADDHTVAQIAPSGIFGQIINVNCDNPLLSSNERVAICGATNGAGAGVTGTTGAVSIGKRNVEGGGRQDDLRHTEYRIVVGATGDINDVFTYDAYAQMGRSIYNENYNNDFSVMRTRNALNDITLNGQVVCADANARAAGCVPYNIFATGGVTAAALKYLETPGFEEGSTTEYITDASISGDLGKYGIQSPLSDQGVGIAIGTEYRKEVLALKTDAEFTSGDLAGQGGPTIGQNGEFSVYEFFGELRVPLITDKPLVKSLEVTGGYRNSHYSTAGKTDTYKGEVIYAPISALKFRGSYNRAVRAPNVVELFAPSGQGLFAGSDPCSGAIGSSTLTATAAQCARSGVTAAQYGNIVNNTASQYTQFSGGNPNLKPEIADTLTGGVVIAPTSGPLRGFSASADYFHIKVKQTIGTIGAQVILTQCVQNNNLCDLVQRDPTNGSLFLGTVGQVVNSVQNVGKTMTSGIDVGASYRFDLSDVGLDNWGKIGADFTGTWLQHYKIAPGVIATGGVTSYDCKGLYGITCGVPLPTWRHSLRLTYTTPHDVQFSVRWRHIGSVKSDQTSTNPFLAGTTYAIDAKLPQRNYFDLTASARIMDKLSLNMGVNNVFDKDPPLVGSNSLSGTEGNGNTYPGVYDALGRYIHVGFALDL